MHRSPDSKKAPPERDPTSIFHLKRAVLARLGVIDLDFYRASKTPDRLHLDISVLSSIGVVDLYGSARSDEIAFADFDGTAGIRVHPIPCTNLACRHYGDSEEQQQSC